MCTILKKKDNVLDFESKDENNAKISNKIKYFVFETLKIIYILFSNIIICSEVQLLMDMVALSVFKVGVKVQTNASSQEPSALQVIFHLYFKKY